MNGEVLPGDAAGETGAEGFHAGFFGSETGSEALIEIGFGEGVGDFGIGEDAAEKTVAEAEAAGADAIYFGEVGTNT